MQESLRTYLITIVGALAISAAPILLNAVFDPVSIDRPAWARVGKGGGHGDQGGGDKGSDKGDKRGDKSDKGGNNDGPPNGGNPPMGGNAGRRGIGGDEPIDRDLPWMMPDYAVPMPRSGSAEPVDRSSPWIFPDYAIPGPATRGPSATQNAGRLGGVPSDLRVAALCEPSAAGIPADTTSIISYYAARSRRDEGVASCSIDNAARALAEASGEPITRADVARLNRQLGLPADPRVEAIIADRASDFQRATVDGCRRPR